MSTPGAFATGSRQQPAPPCPLYPDSDQTPQRSEMTRCVSIYLHYALNLWAARWRRHAATGYMIMVRYADDLITGFEHHRPTASCRRPCPLDIREPAQRGTENPSPTSAVPVISPRVSVPVTPMPTGLGAPNRALSSGLEKALFARKCSAYCCAAPAGASGSLVTLAASAASSCSTAAAAGSAASAIAA